MNTFDAITDLSNNFGVASNSLKTLRLNSPEDMIMSQYYFD